MEHYNQSIKTGRINRRPILLILSLCLAIILLAAYATYNRSLEAQASTKIPPQDEPNLLYGKGILQQLEKQAHAFTLESELKEHPLISEPKDTSYEQAYTDYVQQYDQPTDNIPQITVTPPTEPITPPDPFIQAQEELRQQRYSVLVQALRTSTTIQANSIGKDKLKTNEQIANQTQDQPSSHSIISNLNMEPKLNQNPNKGTYFNQQNTLLVYDKLRNDQYQLNSTLENITNPFVLRQGTIIPCTLLSGINSDLPGQVIAQVTQNVYDSPSGQYLMIPQGTKVIGQYASHVAMGQERVMLGFNRLIFPNGQALDLGAMPGMGDNGYAGLDAHVNNHFWRLFSNSILLGGITASIAISVDQNRNNQDEMSVSGALSEGLGQSVGNMITRVIEQNMAISPTLQVQPGFTFNVSLIKDVTLPHAYQA